MAGPVTTSIVINFSSTTGSILKAEIDDRTIAEGGYNGGSTSFAPGDEPTFLLYKSSNVTVGTKLVSEGYLSTLSNPSVRKVEQLQFANVKSAELAYPYVGGFLVRRTSPGMPAVSLVGNTVSLASPGVGIVEVEYLTVAEAIKVRAASGSLPVVVYIEGVES
jgi:hypothetical protein